MSRIDDLLAGLSSDDVPRVRLGDVTFEGTERNVTREYTEVRSVTNSQGLVRTSDYFDNTRTSADTKDYKVVRPGMFVYNPSRINVGSISWLDEPAPAVVSPMYVVFGVDTARISSKYLDFFLSSNVGRRQIGSKTEVGARFRLTYRSLSDISIPLPAVATQNEIVQLLGTFTSLAASLEAELEARRRQYAFYRDSLMSLPKAQQVRRVPMGELGRFIRGRRFTKADVVEVGIPSIHYGEIYTHYGVAAHSTVSHVRSELADQLRFAEPGDVVIASVGETVEDVAKAVAWLGGGRVAIHDDTFLFRSDLDPTYVSYFMQTADFHSQKNKYVARAKVKRLSGESLAKIQIPVPSPDEQARIVEILDKFDALVNDLSIGLPAELAARRKQYEYYRDQLLTFEEAAA